MHLLNAQAGAVVEGEAVDLGQTPGDVVVLSAADTELAALAAAQGRRGDAGPSLRLASLLHLAHPLSVDLHVDRTVRHARLVVLRLLGGRGYWPYGLERVTAACRENGTALAVLPGDDQPDPELAALSTLPADAATRLWRCLVHGGPANADRFLAYAASLLGEAADWREPAPLLRAGAYLPGRGAVGHDEVEASWTPGRPVAALVFYRALVQAGNLAAVDALVAALGDAGLNPLPVFVTSLKDAGAAAMLAAFLDRAPPAVILNTTGFAVGRIGGDGSDTPFAASGAPVLQTIFSGEAEAAWREGARGLSPRDLAMNVALPEVDGRIVGRAVSFKAPAIFDDATQCRLSTYAPVPDRARFTAELAAAWARLARTSPAERRVGLVLANYPIKDGRLANGVGLDTPAGTIEVLNALRAAGYAVEDAPADGRELIARLLRGPTNARRAPGSCPAAVRLPLDVYRRFFDALPEAARAAVEARWGPPEDDPKLEDGAFPLAVLPLGNLAVGVQPARGYDVDPAATYHAPDLAPPHAYLAFYAWLRTAFGAHAVVHMGKHGTLEWLPGKAVALSGDCFPEAVLGPLPHVYPFIVNDPGEGTQAKRRAAAVIVDHLTPPLTRAESHGPLRDLERLVDEFYEAQGLDPRRATHLRREILGLARSGGLERDLGLEGVGDDERLVRLDAHLCELKELQIRDGLHVFGRSPEGGRRDDLLVALARVPRGRGEGGDASLSRALADDLGVADGFDPLDADLAAPWVGERPEPLASATDAPWRSAGDTVERLEIVARRLVGDAGRDAPGPASAAVLRTIETVLRPNVEACGGREIAGLLTALDGRFLEPGPSGAPTRGRPDVLPTGRNFYSVDTRAVPTPAAWTLGFKSAELLVERYLQDNGDWPRAVALSAWGTANMRTGGDDIAQGLALMGVRPRWEDSSNRVTGFEILPADLLGRPRVDVTLRVSGFFRDAFPGQIELFDEAVRAVAELDETEADNPLAARVRAETAAAVARGEDAGRAARRASFRVFGSQPGAYGAGLQALIDARGWEDEGDLARAFVAWGGFAYGKGAEGAAAPEVFRRRLRRVELVLHNQDNREHDILDSDDYYQFEGGLTAAVRAESGRRPTVYHNDHSRPESPRVRPLKEEIALIVRGRAANPKWIAGVMRHGYKGAFEIAATVDYLFAFAATTGFVEDHHFDALYAAYLKDDAVRGFIADANPAALKEIAGRFGEARERGLWRPADNEAPAALERLAAGR